jgi:ectoine hydroxylase-related dioxygenase (phytanoyl-CoA dioxygenase family)
MNDSELSSELSVNGYAMMLRCLSGPVVDELIEHTESVRQQTGAKEAVASSGGVYAIRNLVDLMPEISNVIRSPEISTVVSAVLGTEAFLIRSTLFDKTDSANWGVFWHQDLSIAVKERHDVPGFSAWTRKAGVDCVQPPTEIMSAILTVRIHLDECTADNGALRVLPGSHRSDRLTTDRIEHLAAIGNEVLCEVPAGGLLLMSPLLLHASSPMHRPGHRRVIHLEFASRQLPEPLDWKYRIPIQQA